MSATSLHSQPSSVTTALCPPLEEGPPPPPQRSASLLSPVHARSKTANVDRELPTAGEQNKDSFDGGDQVKYRNKPLDLNSVASYLCIE